jgi:hypothetical protein
MIACSPGAVTTPPRAVPAAGAMAATKRMRLPFAR